MQVLRNYLKSEINSVVVSSLYLCVCVFVYVLRAFIFSHFLCRNAVMYKPPFECMFTVLRLHQNRDISFGVYIIC